MSSRLLICCNRLEMPSPLVSGQSWDSPPGSGEIRYRLSSTDTLVSFQIDPNQAAVTLAKLQNPVKASFDSINDTLKETHSCLNKYTKSLDKVPSFVHDFCLCCNC